MHLQKYLVLLLFVTSFGYNLQSFAQNNEQDTIQQSFDKEAFKASLKELPPKEFCRLFEQQYQKDSLKTAIGVEYIKEEMLFSNDLETQFWGHFTLAYWNNQNLNQDECLANLDKGLFIGKSLKNDTLVLNSLQYKGRYCFDFGRYEEAIDNYLDALKIANKINEKLRKLIISHDIGLIKMHTNDYEGGIEIMEAILDEIQGENTHPILLNIYISLTKGYIEVEEYEKAEEYCEIGLNLSDQLKDEVAKFYFYSFLGTIEGINKNYKKAHELLDECLEIAEEIKRVTQEVPIVFFLKGEVFYKEKKYKEAIKTLLKAEVLMKKNKLNFIKLEEVYALLAKSYNEIGDIKNSVKFYEKTNEAYKKNDERQGSISADIIKKYDLAELKEELDTVQATSKSKSVWLSTSIVLIVLLLISFGFIYRNREKQNKKKFEKLVATSTTALEVVKPIKVIAENDKNYISDAIATDVLQKLKKFEDKKLYLQKNSTLADVASKLNTNPTYLSKTVNKHKGKSFSNYIKELRVQYVIDRLKSDKKFRLYTIEAIAKEVGYIRAEPFSKSFKSKTGLYPSYFIKQLNSQEV